MSQFSEPKYYRLENEDTLVSCEKVSTRYLIVCVRVSVLQNVCYEKKQVLLFC